MKFQILLLHMIVIIIIYPCNLPREKMRILIIFGGLEKSVSPLIFIFHTQKLNPKSYSNILEKSSYFISHGFASSWGVKTVDEVSLITQS